MIALLYFIFLFLIYLPISIWVIRKSYLFAKDKYQRGWLGGIVAALIMYNLVFWDWIPVILIHKHLCETEGGFWVYKTPGQWVKEHPEVLGQDWGDSSKVKLEKLNENYQPDKSFHNAINRYWYSQWIYMDSVQPVNVSFIGTVTKIERRLVEAKTGQILANSINFQRGGSFHAGNYKFWLNIGNASCNKNANKGVQNLLKSLIDIVKGDNK
ncbi:hypothetical protein GO003_019565 [Methylicorpusculum oleiharenae]|uniref:hypothetical protein n=1 Tax=Methylicorpusculum oleiharenae TaxID=1338687 RepID=UPI001356B15C|nr:hypothetical protein [Methylicorpusculum oleiharenae]MCD2452586.1 hypothetical protein [Methylicorpusculum oleiharenae]